MTPFKIWMLAARPKTLVAVLCPIAIGTTMAASLSSISPLICLFTVLTGLGIQISTNFCNDYIDFIKGADTQARKGPIRVTQSGLVSIQTMKKACAAALLLTMIAGLILLWHGGLIIGLLLAVSLLLAVGYTAGPVPLAYKGLGDLFVFLFFGPIACLATYYLQTGSISLACNISGIALGAFSTAILAVNNIRDIEEDQKSGKRTLTVRFGIVFGKTEYILLLTIPAIITLILGADKPLLLISLAYLIPAFVTGKTLLYTDDAKALNRCLAKTGFILFLYTLCFCIGWLYT
jgi:1,4-dihydroxy-2-naphthoate octaprenyltransferase